MAYSETSDRVYCADYSNLDSAAVTVINGTTNQVVTTIRIDDLSAPFLLWCRSGDRMYCSLGNSVSVIDCANDSVEKTITMNGTGAMALDTIDNLIYHICYSGSGSKLAVIDVSADTAWHKILTIGDMPVSVVWNSRKDVVYATTVLGISVWVIDCPTDSIIASLNFNGYPLDTYWNSLNNKVYISVSDMSRVLTFDPQTLQILDTIPMPGYPTAMAWDKLTNRTYVGHWDGSCVAVLRDNMPGVAEGSDISVKAGRPALEVVGTPARRQVKLSARSCFGADPTVRIYDPAGRCVQTLFSVGLKGGQCQFLWDGTDAAGKLRPSGTYFARLTADNGSVVRKVVFFTQ
jgi:DNA-binding beta-propeller fold protein YncE